LALGVVFSAPGSTEAVSLKSQLKHNFNEKDAESYDSTLVQLNTNNGLLNLAAL
jgi:hypothetical protein